MKTKIACLLVLLLYIPAFAQPAAKQSGESRAQKALAAYVQRSQAERPAAIAAEQQRRRPGSRVHEEEAKLRDPLQPFYPGLFLYDASVDDIGWTDETITVLQVIDENNAIFSYEATQAALYWQETIATPLRNFHDDKIFWYNGPTRGYQDGEQRRFARVVWVPDTTSYQTPLGSQTVPRVVPVAIKPHQFMQQSESREWTFTDGRKVTASLVKPVRAKELVLLSAEGKTSEVDPDELSDSDRDFVRQYQRDQATRLREAVKQERRAHGALRRAARR